MFTPPLSPVEDTAEVIEARANFLAAFNVKAARTKRSAQVRHFPRLADHLVNQVLHPINAYAAGTYASPATFAAPNYGASPLAYAAAPARVGLLTSVKLNPGHAVSYGFV